MKADNKRGLRKVTSLLIALAMLVTLSIPAVGAQHVSALEDETQTKAVDKPEVQGQKQPTEKQETKKESTQPAPSKETAPKKETKSKSNSKKADAKSAVAKTAERIEIVSQPDNNEVIEGSSYDFSGLEVKIIYNDSSQETLSYDGDTFEVPTYSPDGTDCYLMLDTDELNEGNPKVKVIYLEDDGSGEAGKTLSTEFDVVWVKARTVKNIEIASKPKNMHAYVGFDQLIVGDGLKVRVNYTDGKSELVSYGYGSFGSPTYDPEASLKLVVPKLKEENNTITVQYGREDYNDIGDLEFKEEKQTTFTVQGETIKLPTGIKIIKPPTDADIYLNDSGDPIYDFTGLKVEIQYDDHSSETVEFNSENYMEPKYQPEGTTCYIDVEFEAIQIGQNQVNVEYTMGNDGGASGDLMRLTTPLTVTGKEIQEVESLEVTKGPVDVYAYIGLDKIIVDDTIGVKVTYKDGKTETVKYAAGEFGTPRFDPDASLRLVTSKVTEGDNTVLIQYGREQYNDVSGSEEYTAEKSTSFTVKGKKIKLPIAMEITQLPTDNTIYVGRDGDYSYNLKGMEAEIKYSDNSSERIDFGTDKYYDPEFQPPGTNCIVGLDIPDDPGELQAGDAQLNVVYTMKDGCSQDEEALKSFKKTIDVKAVNAPGVTSLEVQEGQKSIYAYVGLDRAIADDGMTVRINYDDGTSEELKYEDGRFETPKYNSNGRIRMSVSGPIKEGNNAVLIQYGETNYDEASGDDVFEVIADTTINVQGQKIPLPTGISVAQQPKDKDVYIGSKGGFIYSPKGMEIKIQYDNGDSETVKCDEDGYGAPAYQPKGSSCRINTNVPEEMQLGKNELEIRYDMEVKGTEEEELLKTFKTTTSVEGKAAKTVTGLSIYKKPEKTEVYAGLDENVYLKGLQVKIHYQDGTEEIMEYDGDTDLGTPKFAGDDQYFDVFVKRQHLEPGENTVNVIYKAQDKVTDEINTKTASFKITAKAFTEYTQDLDTKEQVGTEITSSGRTILNANQELWSKPSDLTVKYEKKTGIEKAYGRVYLDTKGTLTILDKDGKTAGTYEGGKEIGAYYALLNDGRLIEVVSNKVVASGVKTWNDGTDLIVKQDGTAYKYTKGQLIQIENAKNIVTAGAGVLQDKDGNLYGIKDVSEKSGKIIYKAYLIKNDIEELIGNDFALGKDGKTYWERNWRKPVLNKEVTGYKECVFYTNASEDDYNEGYLLTAKDKSVYKMVIAEDPDTYDEVVNVTALPGEFEGFTGYGYKASGTYYDINGKATDILKSEYGMELKTDHMLYINGKKLLTKVEDFAAWQSPAVITRSDGTTWLFDIDEPQYENRLRVCPPEKLTKELISRIYGDPIDISKFPVTIASQKYDGKAKKPAVTVKDGKKTLQRDVDYTVTYSNNINAGTAKAIITGKGGYTGTITKTFAITKASQTISGTSSFKKTYGNSAFSLGLKAKTKLSYKSSSTSVATVSSAGKVTLKGPGKATISIKAASSQNYNAASKNVTITVNPKKMATPGARSTKSKTLKATWKKDSKASGYQVVIAQNTKFTKGKKTATITRNKTTSKTFTKLSKKKTYYVKVRAYKKVGSQKLYGSYSKAKRIKIK